MRGILRSGNGILLWMCERVFGGFIDPYKVSCDDRHLLYVICVIPGGEMTGRLDGRRLPISRAVVSRRGDFGSAGGRSELITSGRVIKQSRSVFLSQVRREIGKRRG